MNYLAHVALVAPTPEARVGAILGDFMRGVDRSSIPKLIWEGVEHHRAVDVATDTHPATRRGIALLPPEWRRFGGILLDVYFDHLLVRNWTALRPQIDLPDLTHAVYGALEAHNPVLPERLQRVWPRMREEDWLASYGEIENIRISLKGIGRRFRRRVPLEEALTDLVRLDPTLEVAFLEVMQGLSDLDELRLARRRRLP